MLNDLMEAEPNSDLLANDFKVMCLCLSQCKRIVLFVPCDLNCILFLFCLLIFYYVLLFLSFKFFVRWFFILDCFFFPLTLC